MKSFSPTEALILGILGEARDLGFVPMLRTVLHKLVYLVDVYTAEETGGQTFTRESWRFLHFGPFAVGVAEAMEKLVADRCMFVDKREHATEDSEFMLYSPTNVAGEPLRQIGLPGGVPLRLDADLRRFARPGSLPALLDYVYFRTIPMAEAVPGQTLSFEKCERLPLALFKPIAMTQMTPKNVGDARKRIHEAFARSKEASKFVLPVGPYDEAYFRALSVLDGDPLPVGLKGLVRLTNE